jgi:hypothetical protein
MQTFWTMKVLFASDFLLSNVLHCSDSSLIESNDEQVLASEIERDLSEVCYFANFSPSLILIAVV